jgi:hypothetical protein
MEIYPAGSPKSDKRFYAIIVFMYIGSSYVHWELPLGFISQTKVFGRYQIFMKSKAPCS